MEEEQKKENPKGYYLADVPTGYAKVIAKGEKQVPVEELLIKMANALEEAGIMKE